MRGLFSTNNYIMAATAIPAASAPSFPSVTSIFDSLSLTRNHSRCMHYTVGAASRRVSTGWGSPRRPPITSSHPYKILTKAVFHWSNLTVLLRRKQWRQFHSLVRRRGRDVHCTVGVLGSATKRYDSVITRKGEGGCSELITDPKGLWPACYLRRITRVSQTNA